MKVVKWLDLHFEECLMVILLVLITVVSLMQVIVRNIETLPALKWAEEFCRFCWIGSVFLSLPYTIRSVSMLRVCVLLDLLPQVPAMENEKVVVIPISDEVSSFVRTVYLSWTKRRLLSPAARRVRGYIVENYATPETKGQPPRPPKELSNRVMPASMAAMMLAMARPRVLWKWSHQVAWGYFSRTWAHSW